jgi:hypothetical protein
MVRVAIGNRDARIESPRNENHSAVHFQSVVSRHPIAEMIGLRCIGFK